MRSNIHTVLERVLPLAETEAGCSVILQRDYDLSIPNILGDADRLTQAVWNLVRNAIQAGANRIILRTRVEHGQRIRDRVNVISLRLEVIDDGDGVPEALAEHVFLPLVSSRAEGRSWLAPGSAGRARASWNADFPLTARTDHIYPVATSNDDRV